MAFRAEIFLPRVGFRPFRRRLSSVLEYKVDDLLLSLALGLTTV
jgi:hypothetical protein